MTKSAEKERSARPESLETYRSQDYSRKLVAKVFSLLP